MSGGIRVRRVSNPMPVQRGPAPFEDLTTAWDNHAEAKSALHRAEARLEEAESYCNSSYNPSSQDPRGILSPGYKHHLVGMDDLGRVRVPVDRVPSLKIGSRQQSQTAKNRYGRANYGRDKTRKRVTIVDNFDVDQGPLHLLSPPRSDRDRLTGARNADLSPSRSIDNAQIQRLEGQLKSLSHTLKSSAYESDRMRSQRNNYDSRHMDPNWGSSSSRADSYDRRTSTNGLSPSSQEILSRGSANLSIDNSTAIRVLNDMPPRQHSENERNRMQKNCEHREEYVPAYERLYGAPPGERLSDRQDTFVKGDEESELRQRDAARQRVRANRKLASGGSASDHMERLKEKVEQQKAAVASKQTVGDRVRHREGDPVVLQDPDAPKDSLVAGFSVATAKSTVRKVATAPAAPAYKGFCEVETRFQMPDGEVVTEDNLTRKTSRKSRAQRNKSADRGTGNAAEDRALKPSMALQQQNRPEQPSKPSRTVRKVHKASKTVDKRPKRPDRSKDIISTTAWREGQKTVLKILGPPPEKPKSSVKSSAPHSPPTHDTEDPPSSKSVDLVVAADERTKDEISDAELSEHPLITEDVIEQRRNDNREPSPSPDLDKLPSEAKNVLEDLHLNPSSSEDEEPMSENETRKDTKKVSKILKKHKPTKPAKQDPELILPSERVRHYDTDNVRKYMAKQKAERRRKLLEDKKERKLAQERKQEQLRELSKKQKDSIRMSQRNRNVANSQLGETFSKGPSEEVDEDQLNGLDQLPRHHPFRQDGKKIDVTSSDKENKNIWSTSSSDSSTQSSQPSDPLHSPLDHAPPTHGHSLGRIPDAEAEGRPPRQASPIGVVVTQMAGVVSGGQRSTTQDEPGQRAEVMQPMSVGQGFVRKPPLPASSVPSGISTAARTKADRIQALKATAAALQGKIDSEVKKLTGDVQPQAVTSPGDFDRWAYPAGIKTATPGRTVHFSESAVESPAWKDGSPEAVATRYQQMVGSERDHRVFTGSLPGTSSLSAQAQIALGIIDQEHAATRIQAAYRGHSVRQKLDWKLLSGQTLGNAIKRTAQVRGAGVGWNAPLYERGESVDSVSLSEGSLLDSAADDRDYMPTFKSLPTKHSHAYQPPPSTSQESPYVVDSPLPARPISLQVQGDDEWKESLVDGLSVINIYTRKYQNANRAVLYGQLPVNQSQPPKDTVIGYSYNDDFTGSVSSSPKSSKSRQDDEEPYSTDFTASSKTKSKSKTKSTTPSSKSSYKTASRRKRSSRSTRSEVTEQTQNRKTDDDTLDLSPTESFGSSGDDFSHRKFVLRTPSPKASLSTHKGTPDGRTPPSLLSPTASLGSKAPSSPDSTLSSGSIPRSPAAEHQSGMSRSPITKSSSSSHSKSSGRSSRSKSSPSRSADMRTRSSVSSRSSHVRDQQNQFKPVKAGTSAELNGDRGLERPLPRSVLDARSSTTGKPPFSGQYSPAALSLKMASELNLLESLEESVRQLSEMERTRHVSMAQQESVSLARVLQARQRDHEREIQLLSLKARQEVEEANKQLEVVRQRAVETASDAERVMAQARREASDAVNENTLRLIESQADAARVTAEAAKKMAEAQRIPPQPLVPSFDPGKLASDTATAATTAAVTAALEQQRLQQIEFLKEMKGSLAPPALANTRTLGVGDHTALSSRNPSQPSYSSSQSSYTTSRSDIPHSPKQDYTDDFTESPTKSHRTTNSISSGTIQEASSLSPASDHSRPIKPPKSPTISESIRTASGVPASQNNSNLSIPTESEFSPVKSDYSSSGRRSNSSIQTASDFDGASAVRSPSIAEDIPDDQQPSYTTSSSDSRTKSSSSLSPSSASTPIREKQEKPQTSNFTLGLDDSFSMLSSEMLRQQLRDEEVRAQQQGALFKLREKTLLEKAKVELEWLEHEKRRHKEKGDVETLQIVRKKQQALVAKVQQEQAEMRRLRAAQKAASHERQLLLFQQQEILRMRKATEAVKDHMKDLSNISIASSIGGALSEEQVSIGTPESSPELPEVLSDSMESPLSIKNVGQKEELHQGAGSGDEKDGGSKTAAEKQAQVMMKLKRIQQPLSMKYLTKREQQLTKRRRNAEELLAWQRRLDEEESQIVNMERAAMRRLDSGKSAVKPRPPMKALPPPPTATPRDDSDHDESPSGVTSDAATDATINQEEGGEDESGRRESGSSIAEDVSQGSSVPEEVISEASQKMSTPRTATASAISSDDTLKHTDSVPEDYASESFETADRTITPTMSPLAAPRSSQHSTPSSLESFRAPLSPHRRIMESESGSESEKSFSQTVSEIASDQSDIEGRVKALESELRKRKTEAEKLRRQQKRMQREKLKAQEASLKKQLESYDKLIEKTKAELKTESESAAKMTSVTVKPQIKQIRVSESQRLKDRSHARSLRQRTTSESSWEGGAELSAMRKQRSVSEGSVSSRSSFDDEAGLGREPSYTSFSSVFTPPTTPRLVEDTTPPPPKSLSSSPSTKHDRSDLSASISEEAHDRTSSNTSDEDSQRALMGQKTRGLGDGARRTLGPRQSEELEGQNDSSIVSEVSEDIPSAYSSISATPDTSLKESPRFDAEWDTQRQSPNEKGPDDQRSEQSETSDVPEEVLSVASSLSQDSVRSASKTIVLEERQDSSKVEPTKRIEDTTMGISEKSSPIHTGGHSADELSQKSDKSYSFSSSIRSASSHRSRTHSERSGASYSDDFFESSVSIGLQNKESHSDTDDDISEQLFIASEPSELSVASSGKLALSTDKLPEEIIDTAPEVAPEVTISDRDASEEHEKSEIVSEDDDRTPVASPHEEQLEISQDFSGYEIGDRVMVSGQKRGTLLFKGMTHFAPGLWGGIELDAQQGTNDGSLDGHIYFHCKASHGIFVPADRLEPLTVEQVDSEPEQDASTREDFSTVASEVSDTGQRKLSDVPVLKDKEDIPERSPMSSLSSKTPSESIKPLALVLQSEATDEDSVVEDLSEPMTDDAALAALINSAAAAVESFHEDDIDEIFSPAADAETPRGPPEPELASAQAKEQLVDSITDHLTAVVVRDSVEAITEVAEKQNLQDGKTEISGTKTSLRSTSTERPSSSLLKMLVHDEDTTSPRDDTQDRDKIQNRVEEKENQKVEIKMKIDSTTQTLLTDAITEMITLRNKRAKKTRDEPKPFGTDEIKTENQRTSLPDSPKSPSPETPCSSPFVRNATPYTPDSESPINQEDTTLDDDIFINRVKVETNNVDLKDQDQLPVARPGSPVFGESSGFNPEALSEKLEQMQQLGADIFEGDLFGEQEWFDDDFGTMPKSKSIIQVPVRSQEAPVRTPPIPGTPEPSRLDLTRITQEPFYAVPHNRRDVKSLVDKSVRVIHEKAVLGEWTMSLSPPPEIMGDDTQGSDIESTSRKSYKRLVFNLVGEAYQDITSEQEQGEQLPWTKTKRRPRKYFFDKPPRELPDIAQVVEDRALFVAGLTGRPKPDPAMNRFGKKKKDHVDEILTLELREEEQEWVNYDDDELAVKMQLTEAIFDSLLTDTAMVLNRIQDRRRARLGPTEPEIEF